MEKMVGHWGEKMGVLRGDQKESLLDKLMGVPKETKTMYLLVALKAL